jgi:hypothetical protein
VAWKVSNVLATSTSTRFSSGRRRASRRLADAEYWEKHEKLKKNRLSGARNRYLLQQKFSPGILALVPCGDGHPAKGAKSASAPIAELSPLPRQRLTVSHLRRLETSASVYEQKGFLIRFVHQPRAVHMTEFKSVC